MTNKRKIWDKVADRVVSTILTLIGILTLLIVAGLFTYPHYQKYQYMKECKDIGKSTEFANKLGWNR